MALVRLYKRLQEITSVSREIETGLLRLEDRRPAVSVFVCKPGQSASCIFMTFFINISAMLARRFS